MSVFGPDFQLADWRDSGSKTWAVYHLCEQTGCSTVYVNGCQISNWKLCWRFVGVIYQNLHGTSETVLSDHIYLWVKVGEMPETGRKK